MPSENPALLAQDEVENHLEAEVASDALRSHPGDRDRIAAIGNDVHADATREVEADHQRGRRERTFSRIMQVVDYLFGLLYVLIVFELVLELLGARDSNAFKAFLDNATAPFLAPFKTLLPAMKSGSNELMISYVIALAVYALIHFAIHKMFLNIARPNKRLA